MATDPAQVSRKNDNSLGMSVCLRTIKAKFPAAANTSTQTAHAWFSQARPSLLVGRSSADSPAPSVGNTAPSGGGRELMLLDCREKAEYAVSHIKGAVRVDADAKDLQQTEEIVRQIVSAGAEGMNVVCYCSVGYRSSRYAQLLAEKLKEVENVRVSNLEGSIFKWANEGRPVVDSTGQEVRKVHPYNAVFGRLLYSTLRSSTPDNSS